MSVLGNQVLIWSGALFNRTFITDLSWQSASRKGPYSLLYLPTKDAGSWSPSQTSPRNFRTPPNLCRFQAALCYEARESQNSSAVREGGRRERKGKGVGAGAKTLHICLCKFTYLLCKNPMGFNSSGSRGKRWAESTLETTLLGFQFPLISLGQ